MISQFENFSLQDIVTPIDADALEDLLIQSQYPVEKRKHLVTGFREGFDLGYRGPCK